MSRKDFERKSIEFEHVGTFYRVTFHPQFNVGLIEIEESVKPKWWEFWLDRKWERIFFGHDTVIRDCLDFYDEQIEPLTHQAHE